jgi:hypothetical protein
LAAATAWPFDDLYYDIITHVPNAGVKELDPYNKVVKTAAGDFQV